MGRVTVARTLAKLPRAMLKALPPFLLSPNPEVYLSDNFVVFDLETNTKGDASSPQPCWPANSIVCGSWCHGYYGAAHNIYGNELEMGELVDALENADFIVAHNGKFDIGWLKRAGIDLYKLVLYDTMVAEYCMNGNLQAELSLDALSTKYLGKSKAPYINLCMKGKVDPSDMPRSKLIARCNWDITQTRELFLLQLEEVRERGLLGHVYTRCLLSAALADIESNGMHIDATAVGERYRESAAKLAAATAAVDEFTGGINPNSPKQVKEFVYEVLKFTPKYKGKGRNATPIYSTKIEDLLALKTTNKRQREFVKLKKEYSKYNAEVTKNLLFFQGVATDKRDDIPDGVFYAQFNQCITKTHRLSSSGIRRTFEHIVDDKGKVVTKSVQFQNFSRQFKPLFSPRKKGWSMGEADGCFMTGHHMLMADGKWKEVSTVAVGDKVLSFDENREGTATRKLRYGVVEHTKQRRVLCYRVHLENGVKLNVSGNHQFLGCDKHSNALKYITPNDMLASNKTFYVSKFCDTYHYGGNQVEWGALGGMLDCDGSVSHDKMQITQSVANPVDARIREVLETLNFPIRQYNFRRSALSTADVVSYNITGIASMLRVAALSGSIKAKLNFLPRLEGKAMSRNKRIKVVDVEYLGQRPVHSIQTSTKTYIVDGYCNHNCQLEFRVAAFLGQCPIATQAIVNNLDVHTDTMNVLAEGGQIETRQDSKQHTFKPLFGGMSGTKAEVAYYKWFASHYSGIAKAQQRWIDNAQRTKEVKMIHGFKFFFPDCHMQQSGYVTNSTNIKNYPVID